MLLSAMRYPSSPPFTPRTKHETFSARADLYIKCNLLITYYIVYYNKYRKGVALVATGTKEK